MQWMWYAVKVMRFTSKMHARMSATGAHAMPLPSSGKINETVESSASHTEQTCRQQKWLNLNACGLMRMESSGCTEMWLSMKFGRMMGRNGGGGIQRDGTTTTWKWESGGACRVKLKALPGHWPWLLSGSSCRYLGWGLARAGTRLAEFSAYAK